METIVNANGILKSIIGDQTIKNVEYRLLKYTLEVEVEEGLLLDNVITGQIVFLSKEEKEVLYRLPKKPDRSINQLISDYYLVPVDFDEINFVRGYRSVLQQVERSKEKPITKYTLFPTTCCNARCFYCFEAGYEKINMGKETAKKVAEYIRDNVGGKQAELEWFGGEPTVAMKCIDYICCLLREYGVDFVSGMVSNGYLFSEDVVRKAVEEWKLKSIQITLDGTEEIYNQTKNFAVSGNAYKRVLNNITLLLDAGIRVTVLMNLDYHNCDDLFKLTDELSVRFKQYKNFRMTSHVLFNGEGFEKVFHTEQEEEELAGLNHRLAAHMKEVGLNGWVMGDVRYKKKLPMLRHVYCMANDSGAIVIGPNGNLFKCEHIEYDLTSNAGIDKNGFEQAELDEWFVALEEERCADCCLYPDCFVPKKCLNRAKCYHIDAESKIEGYRDNITKIFHDLSRGKQEDLETGKKVND